LPALLFQCRINTVEVKLILQYPVESGHYTLGVAITNQRILTVDDKNDTFLHKDYADNARQKPITIDGVEFLRRFCLHILSLRFVKIRRYGIYSNSTKRLKEKLSTLHAIIKTKETSQQRLKRITGFDIYKCPFCKNGVMKIMEILPRIRYPVSFYFLDISVGYNHKTVLKKPESYTERDWIVLLILFKPKR